jgi:hypothetical protein
VVHSAQDEREPDQEHDLLGRARVGEEGVEEDASGGAELDARELVDEQLLSDRQQLGE